MLQFVLLDSAVVNRTDKLTTYVNEMSFVVSTREKKTKVAIHSRFRFSISYF